MTSGLLDTSAYSAFMRGHREMKLALQRLDRIVLTPVVLGELGAGFRAGGRKRQNEQELGRFMASPRVDVVNLDAETAARYAMVLHALRQAGTPIPTNDVWIAASAMQYGLRILTTDEHFEKVGQVMVDLFEAR